MRPIQYLKTRLLFGILCFSCSLNTIHAQADLAPEFDSLLTTDDIQALTTSGSAAIKITNSGNMPSSATDLIIFSDVNSNNSYDPLTDEILGQDNVPAIASMMDTTIPVSISGNILFRGDPLHVIVDPGQLLNDLDPSNNTNASSLPCTLTPPQPPGPIAPVLLWERNSFVFEPLVDQVMSSPILVDLDADGQSEVLFSSFQGPLFTSNGVLRAIRGTDATDFPVTFDPSQPIFGSSNIAAGNIDADPFPEIFAIAANGSQLICFEHDGTTKWVTSPFPGSGSLSRFSAPVIANISGSSTPEIIVSNNAFDANGNLLWQAGDPEAAFPIVADINLDGLAEVIIGNIAVQGADGLLIWSQPLASSTSFAAIANFDADTFPEVVLVGAGEAFLVEAESGALKCGPVVLSTTNPGPNSQGGSPTIADFDNDGLPEVGIASSENYEVFEMGDSGCSLLWSIPIVDGAAGATTGIAFDFENDGFPELIHCDSQKLRILNGATGSLLFEISNTSSTLFEGPIVGDINADGKANIVVVANDYSGPGNHGIRAFSSADWDWAPARPIWNQHSFHQTNVLDDASIPAMETNSWDTPVGFPLVGYRNATISPYPIAFDPNIANLTSSHIQCTPNSISARIGNIGSADATGVPVAFYDGSPQFAVLLGVVTVTIAADGFTDVSLNFGPMGQPMGPISVVANDLGNGSPGIMECDSGDNIHINSFDCNAPEFRRGDSNNDGAFDIGDVIHFLASLFSTGGQPPCLSAADSNDDGQLDIGDAVNSLSALFSAGAPPPAPGPINCGIDPTPDPLSCNASCP